MAGLGGPDGTGDGLRARNQSRRTRTTEEPAQDPGAGGALLINVPNPEQIVSEMVALVRPGGVVALQDVDRCSWVCDPPHPAWTTLLTALNTAWTQDGADPFIGRRLPGLLRRAGLVDVGVDVHVQAWGRRPS